MELWKDCTVMVAEEKIAGGALNTKNRQQHRLKWEMTGRMCMRLGGAEEQDRGRQTWTK